MIDKNVVDTSMDAKRKCAYPKAVHVRWYWRYRFKRWERVCEHCRSYPNQQLTFNF